MLSYHCIIFWLKLLMIYLIKLLVICFLTTAIYKNVVIKIDYIKCCLCVILYVFMCINVCVFFLSLLLQPFFFAFVFSYFLDAPFLLNCSAPFLGGRG
jgi:hypothetical protein